MLNIALVVIMNLSFNRSPSLVSLVLVVIFRTICTHMQVSDLQLVHGLHSDNIPHNVGLADCDVGRSALSLRLSQRHR